MRLTCYKKDLLRSSSNTIKNYKEHTTSWSSLMKISNKLLMTLMLLNLFTNSLLEIAKLMLDFLTEVI